VAVSANHKKAHTGSEVKPMVAVAGVWKKKRDNLKTKRNSLFATYTKDPQNFHLAREIKAIDDEIAECTQHVEQERRAERAASPACKLVTSPK
jgi:hypothetical protein